MNYEEEEIFMKANINNSIRLINSVYSLNNQARILLLEQKLFRQSKRTINIENYDNDLTLMYFVLFKFLVF